MALVEGVFNCAAGGMGLSPNMQLVMIKWFPEVRPRPAHVQCGRQLAKWFCPGCGVPLQPGMVCPSCGQSLADQLVALVELQPHRSEDAGW
jgi:hypothetical protein